MTSTFSFYLLWATIQHSLVIVSCWFLPVPIEAHIVSSIVLFTLCHYPNYRLMYVTCLGAIVMYFTLGIFVIREGYYGFFVMPFFFVGHALIGRYLVVKGWEMRVLWLHPNWPFKRN